MLADTLTTSLAPVRIQPLKDEDVDSHLKLAGESTAGLRNIWRIDPFYPAIPQIPSPTQGLCDGGPVAHRKDFSSVWAEVEADQRLTLVIGTYMEAEWSRRSVPRRYTLQAANGWLCNLAALLVRKSESILRLDALDASWLPSRSGQVLCRILTLLLIGIFVALSTGLGSLVQ